MHRTAQKFKLAEAAVRYFKYCQGVVRPKSVAGTPSTPSKKHLLVVLTNLRSSGGARLHHRFSFAPSHSLPLKHQAIATMNHQESKIRMKIKNRKKIKSKSKS